MVFVISFTECAGFSTECAKPVYKKKIITYYDAIVVSGKKLINGRGDIFMYTIRQYNKFTIDIYIYTIYNKHS